MQHEPNNKCNYGCALESSYAAGHESKAEYAAKVTSARWSDH